MSRQELFVPEQLANALATYPDNIALRDRQLTLTYAELAGVVASIKPDLTGQSAIAIFGTPSALFGAIATACLINGVPFVHLDPAMPKSVLENIIAELSITLIVTTQPPKPGHLPADLRVADATNYLDNTSETVITAAPVAPTDTIYLVATSGTTGRPKCIPVTHDAARLSYHWRDAYTPYHADMAVGAYIFAVWEMFRPLRNGATVCFPSFEDLMSPPALAQFISDNHIYEMLFTPSFFEKTLQGITAAQGAGLPLRRIVLNGEVVSDRLITDSQTKLPQAALWNLYSICETHDISMQDMNAPASHKTGVSVGHTMPHLRAVVLDDFDQPCPTGQPGLLHFEGPRMLGPGYINRPDETARRFRALTLSGTETRLYDTGDRGYIDQDGEIFVLGRAAHMLKLRGYSIQTQELTETLEKYLEFTQAIPWVQDIGDHGQALVFFYTADPKQSAQNTSRWALSPAQQHTPENLSDTLRAVLPSYCVPSYFVQLDEMPISQVSGKCDLKALPKITPETVDTHDENTPHTVVEAARIMRCPVSLINPAKSFHDIGGDSLMCVDLVLSLETAYDRRVDFDWALNVPLSRLHELLSPETRKSEPNQFDKKGVFITGATGFLGKYVMAAAAQNLSNDEVIYCLIRPRNNDPQIRLDNIADAMNIDPARLVLVSGSIDDDRFGLSAQAYADLCANVTSVIHCAAMVNLAVERAQMEEWSHAGISTVLQLCKDANADVRFSSSTAVFPEIGGPHPEQIAVLFPDVSGYGAAKIAAEQQIANSGVTATIVRLPSLYDLDTPNPKDIYEIILKASEALGHIPENLSFPMIEVRAAAAFLAYLDPKPGAAFYNLIPDEFVTALPHHPALSKSDWLDQATLSDVERGLIGESPFILCANATFDTDQADEQRQSTKLYLSDPKALIRRRLSYQREPALT